MFLADIDCKIKSVLYELQQKDRFELDNSPTIQFLNHKIKGIKGQNLVYIFVHKGGQILKIGKDNTGKGNRVRQHYGFHAPSTLARSLCADTDFPDISIDNVRDWIRNNTDLIIISVPIDIYKSKALTNRLEAIFLDEFMPRYEKTI